MSNVPLLIIPFILYNLGLVGLFGGAGEPWSQVIFTLGMMSGGSWSMTVADLLVLLALLMLFAEIMKSTRTTTASVVDHLLSTFVFVAFLVEFLLVRDAATSLFFTLMAVSFIDVLAGFSVSLRAAGRDVHFQ